MLPAATASGDPSHVIQELIWTASVPLTIRLAASESRAYDQTDPYLISCPRLAFLPPLLPKLLNFFSEDLIADVETLMSEAGHFEFEGVPLKWQLPVGLLYDIYVLSTHGAEHNETLSEPGSTKPVSFDITVHFKTLSDDDQQPLLKTTEPLLHDSFMNSVKEADFLRSASAKPIMSLSAEDSKALWSAARNVDLLNFSRIHGLLVSERGSIRNIPMKVYLPSNMYPRDAAEGQGQASPASESRPTGAYGIKVVQTRIAPFIASSTGNTASQLRGTAQGSMQRQTVGTALHGLIPWLFPSRRTPILARPILHGAVLPMNAYLDELAVKACYADGWLNIVVAMSS